MWSELCGEGFYEPVDDMGPNNPSLHPELLNELHTVLHGREADPVTVATVIGVLYLLWHLHELPVQQAEQENQLLTKVIFGLALCGLFLHKSWWVLAIILAFTPWGEIGDRLANIFAGRAEEKSTPVPVEPPVEEGDQP